jgi:hypothetical protein
VQHFGGDSRWNDRFTRYSRREDRNNARFERNWWARRACPQSAHSIVEMETILQRARTSPNRMSALRAFGQSEDRVEDGSFSESIRDRFPTRD